ncbi:hypothetical protein I7I48_01124 [Histoplasma ohiense]|nr:hypothetical protein I7I48_01124 [Histoplasma ohiense (nom. inval.)]
MYLKQHVIPSPSMGAVRWLAKDKGDRMDGYLVPPFSRLLAVFTVDIMDRCCKYGMIIELDHTGN